MAYRLSFRASDRTLTDAEVDNWIETIVISLGKVNVVLRTKNIKKESGYWLFSFFISYYVFPVSAKKDGICYNEVNF